MAEDIISRPEDQQELRALAHDLAQELALGEALSFKRERILENVEAHKVDRIRELEEEFAQGIEKINSVADENAAKQGAVMERFSDGVRAFNDLTSDFILALAQLRKNSGEVK